MDGLATNGPLRFFLDLPDPRDANVRFRLIDLIVIAICAVICDFAAFEGSAFLAFVGDAFTQAEVKIVDRTNRDAAEPGTIRGREVEREQPKNLTDFRLAELRAFEVAVSHGSTEVNVTSGRSFAF